MKVVNLCIQDFGAGAYGLSHALNSLPPTEDIQSISLRTSNNYINYPTFAEVKNYGEDGCRKIVDQADVIVFHSAVRPFYSAFHLDVDKMKGKRKVLYFHGSECRKMGDQILKDAADCMHDDFIVVVSTPDLLKLVPNSHWLPVSRDFAFLSDKYGLSEPDQTALSSWADLPKKTILGHAPTSVELKGSAVFYKIITELIENDPKVEFSTIRDMPWDTAMRMISELDILYDQFLSGAYGLVSVEASIFGAAIFCRLAPEVAEIMEKESGLPQPFIQWQDEDELRTQSFMILHELDLQRKFGQMAQTYCRQMHDTVPVANRFLKILEKTK